MLEKCLSIIHSKFSIKRNYCSVLRIIYSNSVLLPCLFYKKLLLSNLVVDSLKFKKLLEPHVLFIRNHLISNLVLDSLKFEKLLEPHVLFIRNRLISNLVLDSLKFKKILELHAFL